MRRTRSANGFTKNEELVLAATQFNADLAISSVAKSTRLSETVARYTLTKLTDQGIVRKFWYINPYALGSSLYNVWFSLAAQRVSAWNKIVEFLIASPEVVFFIETAGRYNHSLTIQASSLPEFGAFLESVGERFGECFLERNTATVLTLTDLPLVRSTKIGGSNQSIHIGVLSPTVKIDALDRSILALLTAEPSSSIQSIARTLGEPSATVLYRFNQLKKSGVIAGCRFFIDYLKLGYSFTYHQLTLSGFQKQEIQKLLSFLAAHPMVYYFEQTIGPWDLEVGTVIREPQDLALFSRNLLEGFGRIISKIDSVPICRFLKLNGTRY
jgi:DNA-binding Lrp family transcriptional regulator